MNILITGAFGFVGTNLSEALIKSPEFRLSAVDINEPNYHVYHEFYRWDELYKINWQNIDTIIHLAGKAHDTKNTTEEQTYFDINLGLTQRIFDYFINSGAKSFIFFSSVKAVTDKVYGTLLTEEDIPNPQTAYGKSKLAAENYILNEPLPGKKKVYILRPCMIHGPGNKGNLNLLYKVVQKGIPWPLGKYENKRSFISIENLAFIIKSILQKNINEGIYNVADDEAISTKRLIQLISLSMGKVPRIWNINKKIIESLAKAGNMLHLPINSERLQKLTESYVVSNSKIKNALGIERLPVTAEDGLKKTLLSFQ